MVHEDDEHRREGDEEDADDVQADGQPAHGTAEEEVGGLVGIQQGLIPAGQRSQSGQGHNQRERAQSNTGSLHFFYQHTTLFWVIYGASQA